MTASRPEGARPTPWRDNIEAVVGAILIVVLFKYFLLEFYQIPSPSMQPTLYGTEPPLDLHDRILADKLSYRFRDPERFEITIFRYPLDRSKNYVKRVWGLPGEQLRIEHGDVWVRAGEDEPWSIPRRPEPVMEVLWKRLRQPPAGATPWRPEPVADAAAPSWKLGADSAEARGDGYLRFVPRSGGSIVDDYLDGYPPAVAERMGDVRIPRSHPVGDLRLSARVRPLPGCTSVAVEIEEGGWLQRLVLPGPAAADGARPRLESVPRPGRRSDDAPRSIELDRPLRLAAGEWTRLVAENLDDRLALFLDGEKLLGLDVLPVPPQDSGLRLELRGEGADLDELAAWRDVHYEGGRNGSAWSVPADSYFMLGDNTQNSSDSRDWTWAHLAWSGADGERLEARGNLRPPPPTRSAPPDPSTNPVRVRDASGIERVFFRDEWGEQRVLATTDELPLDAGLASEAPFVHRELITGRAIASIWPISPRLGVWRPKWVR